MSEKLTNKELSEKIETAWQHAHKVHCSLIALISMLDRYCGSPIPAGDVHGIVELLRMIEKNAAIPVDVLEDLPYRLREGGGV